MLKSNRIVVRYERSGRSELRRVLRENLKGDKSMKKSKLISLFTGILMTFSASAVTVAIPASAAGTSGATITADKTAQWSAQESAPSSYDPYDLRIHGWSGWETAAYMGFTLPSGFSASDITSAELVLTTVSAKNSGTAYIYGADYSGFENGTQYGGTSDSIKSIGDGPKYNTTELASFASPTDTGEFTIDVTDYIGSLGDSAGNVAFRIDVKSQNTNNQWVIGSCTNGYTVPQLVLNGGSNGSLIENPGFSDGNEGWTISNPSAMSISDGVLTSSGSGYEAKLSQTLTDIPNGTYDLTASLTNTDATGVCYLYAKAAGHSMARTAIPELSSAEKITVPGITVDDGTLDIGLYVNGSQTVTLDNLTLTESDSTRVPFLKGGEISKLTYVEDKGGKFYDSDGNQGDALQIMAENGFNLARIRLLNDPGDGHGNGTYYLPEGYMDIEDCLKMAKRAKNKGMQIEFTFAYSDWWSDGGEQYPPNDWLDGASSLSGSSLASYYEGKIYDYTKEVLQKLVDQGTAPEFVSIGNEMQYGMCFGAYASNNGLYNSSTYIAQLANAGARAVREVCPDAKIILHSDNGGKVSKRTAFINALKNIDFDVIGVSYYPYYNSDVSVDTVVSEFATLINTYDKDVIIMETGYNWNDVRGDGYEGQLQDNGYYQDIYGESESGQQAFLTELYAKLKRVLGGRCIGDMYWDPIMLYDGGKYVIGWAISEDGNWTQGNVVSNSTLFDFNGKALSGQNAMKYNTNADDKVLVSGKITKTTTTSSGGGRPGSSQTTTTTTAAANTEVTLSVNGESYTTTTDAFGEYIAAIPYPSNEKISVTAEGYTGSYYIDAPSEGILVTDIDFPTTRVDAIPTAPVYNDDIAVYKTYTESDGYEGNATALTFSVTPNDGVSALSVSDDKNNSVTYDIGDTLPVFSGEAKIVFGVVYPDIVGADIFSVSVK